MSSALEHRQLFFFLLQFPPNRSRTHTHTHTHTPEIITNKNQLNKRRKQHNKSRPVSFKQQKIFNCLSEPQHSRIYLSKISETKSREKILFSPTFVFLFFVLLINASKRLTTREKAYPFFFVPHKILQGFCFKFF